MGFESVGLSRLAIALVPCLRETTISIPPEDHLWRRFKDDPNHLTWDDELGPLPHEDKALQFDNDLSTNWREHLEGHRIGPSGVLGCGSKSAYTLVGELAVAQAQLMGFLVTHSPDGKIPIECSHTSVSWPPAEIHPPAKRPDKRARSRLRADMARNFPFVYGEVTTPPPAGH